MRKRKIFAYVDARLEGTDAIVAYGRQVSKLYQKRQLVPGEIILNVRF